MASTTTEPAPPGPTDRFQSLLSTIGVPDPRATTTSDSTRTAADGSTTTKQANAEATTNASSAVTLDPLAGSASTALTAQTITPEGDGSDGQDSSQAATHSSGGMSSGAKIGIGVGVGVGLAVLIAVIALFFVMRKRRRNRYSSHPSAENMRGQPAMTSTEPALAGATALGRSSSYRSNNRSSYHSLSPTIPPPMPHTAADPLAETTRGTVPAQPTIIPPSQQSLPHQASGDIDTPRARRSLEAEVLTSPATQSLSTPAPPYEEAPSPVDEPPSRPVSPVSPISATGSRPPSLRRSLDD